ncbi:MAG TPA: hypothetical protein P5293_06615 [Bacteroidales bacterium]|nr:hypothetical protein [Bacteroidales bacterium]
MNKPNVWLSGYVIGVKVVDVMEQKDRDLFREDLWDSFRNLISVEENFDSYILEFEDVGDIDPKELIDKIERIQAKYLKE